MISLYLSSAEKIFGITIDIQDLDLTKSIRKDLQSAIFEKTVFGPGNTFKNTTTLRAKVTAVAEKYSTNKPVLKGLKSFLDGLVDGEHLVAFSECPLNTDIGFYLQILLDSLNKGESFEKNYNNFIATNGTFWKKYHISQFGYNLLRIGSFDRSFRICRFCGKSAPNATFKNNAHAISEAIGNKLLFINEECDECNSRFSRTIENSMIESVSVFRTLIGGKGKGGTKKIKGGNFEMEKVDSEIRLYLKSHNRPQIEPGSYIINLQANAVIYQDIYRCLCKYFLSLVDFEILPKFKKTIEWINGFFNAEVLPLVAWRCAGNQYINQPLYKIYLRKDPSDKSMPYAVGALSFFNLTYVYIIPFTDQDDRSFVEKDDYDFFKSTFSRTGLDDTWMYQDFSNDTKDNLIFSLNLNEKPIDQN